MQEKARKKKKIKAIKSKNKERTAIAQINETQQTWKSFVAKVCILKSVYIDSIHDEALSSCFVF